MGKVKDGSITLRANLSRQIWKRVPLTDNSWYYPHCVGHGAQLHSPADIGPFLKAAMTTDIENSYTDLELWSFAVADNFALALQPVEGATETFKRIGAIRRRSARNDEGDREKRTFTII